MGEESKNGPQGLREGDSYVLLVFHKEKFTCEVKGSVENFDQALAMLEMAKRYFERQLNTAEASKILGPMPTHTLPFLRGGKG